MIDPASRRASRLTMLSVQLPTLLMVGLYGLRLAIHDAELPALSAWLRFGALAGSVAWREGTIQLTVAEPWRFVAAVYCHADGTHLAANALGYAAIAHSLRNTLGARTVHVFLVAAVLGFALSAAAFSWTGRAFVTMGASGGVAGLAGYVAQQGRDSWTPRFRGAAIASAVYIGLLVIAPPSSNHVAHATAFLAGLHLARAPRSASRWSASLLALIPLPAIFACHLSPIWRQLV